MLVFGFTEHPVWRVQCLEKECTTPKLKIRLLAKVVILFCLDMQNNAYRTIKWYDVVIINVNNSKIIEDADSKTPN